MGEKTRRRKLEAICQYLNSGLGEDAALLQLSARRLKLLPPTAWSSGAMHVSQGREDSAFPADDGPWDLGCGSAGRRI
jgi:hypothetical protein